MQLDSRKPRKTLSVFSLVMINVIAVDSLRSLAIGAEYGFSVLFYYLLAALLFFFPTAFVAAELATAWPKRGGLYIWIREAFGGRAALFTVWLQWVYNIVWYPTILAFVAAMIAHLFNPELANDKIYLLFMVLFLFWATTLVNCLGMKFSSLVSTIGAIFGTLLPMVLIIALAGLWLLQGHPSEITFSWQTFTPDLSEVNHLVLFIGILFSLIGMEMSAVHADEVKQPQRDYPKAVLYSAVIILATLMFSSLAIAIVIPQRELSLVSGLLDAFKIFLSAFHLAWLAPLVALIMVVGSFSSVSAWVIGPSKALFVASQDGYLPRLLCHVNQRGVPVAILVLQGIIVSVLSSVFLLMPSINSSYWLLSALTAQLALIVYVMLFAAFLYLRRCRNDVARAYRVPGGFVVASLLAGLAIMTCVAAIALGFLPPAQIPMGHTVHYVMTLFIGMLVLSVPPLLFPKRDSLLLEESCDG